MSRLTIGLIVVGLIYLSAFIRADRSHSSSDEIRDLIASLLILFAGILIGNSMKDILP